MTTPMLLAALVLAAPVPTRPAGGALSSLPPRLVIAQFDGGVVKMRETRTVTVPVTQTVTVERGGKAVTETRTAFVQETRTVETSRALKDFQVRTASGKKVEPQAVAERLKKPTAVVLSQDGGDVDPLFRAALKDDTLVLIPVPQAPPPPAAPAAPKR